MTQYSLYPAFVKINYHTAFRNSTMTIPLVEWSDAPDVGGAGSVPQWDSGMIDTDEMINNFVDTLNNIIPDTTVFDDYVIFKYDDPDGLPHPVAGKAIGTTGLLSDDAVRACTGTFNFRTTGFHPFKIVIVDTVPSAGFVTIHPGSFSSDQQDFIDFLLGNDHGFAGRDGLQPYQCISLTFNINDKLKRV
jgi:hypothetical protein